MKNGTVPTEPGVLTLGDQRELMAALAQALPTALSAERARTLIRNKGPWQTRVRQIMYGEDLAGAPALQLELWERHLADRYNLSVNCGKLVVPELPAGILRRPLLGVNSDRLTLSQRYGVCAQLFPSWCWSDDPDAVHVKSQSRPKGDYAFWYDGGVEPDERYQNLSPDQLDDQKLLYMVIGERLLVESFHWEQTGGGHLDLVNWTITASRNSDGRAFYAHWSGRQFKVYRWERVNANPHGRPRQVVLPS